MDNEQIPLPSFLSKRSLAVLLLIIVASYLRFLPVMLLCSIASYRIIINAFICSSTPKLSDYKKKKKTYLKFIKNIEWVLSKSISLSWGLSFFFLFINKNKTYNFFQYKSWNLPYVRCKLLKTWKVFGFIYFICTLRY